MRDEWRQLSQRFNALQKRERMLVLVGVVLGTALLYDLLFLEPLLARSKRQVQQLSSASRNLTAVQDQLRALRMGDDPGAPRRTYRDALKEQLAQLDRDMKNLQVGLVPPERMAQLLQEMLGRTRGTKLVSIRTLPVQR
ncbi:MAG: type II secretion system protein M, partial [Betaproteobacteria bacterium]|nr:type II secretion system protein M [Betaproteobacteria bacterium]